MARLRSKQLHLQTSEPSHNDENIAAEENLEVASDADGNTTFSTANEDEEQQMERGKQMEQNNSNPSRSRGGTPETTKTPAPGIWKRILGGTPWSMKSTSLPDVEQESTAASNADEAELSSPSRILFESNGPQEDEMSEVDAQEKPAKLPESLSEEEQLQNQILVEESLKASREEPAALVGNEQDQAQQTADADPEHDTPEQSEPVTNGSEADDVPSVVEMSPQIEPLRPANSKLNKPKKAKPQIHNDNSFHYSRAKDASAQPPDKDIYNFELSPEEDAPQKKTKTVAHSQTAKRNDGKATKKNETATKRSNEPIVEDAVSPRRRGRQPKNSQNTKTTNRSTEVPELPAEESSPAKRKPGRPKGPKTGGNQSSQVNGVPSSQVSNSGQASSRQEQFQNGNGIARNNEQGSSSQEQLQNGDRNSTRNASAPKNNLLTRKPTPAFQERPRAPERIEKVSGANHHEPLVEIDDSQDEDEDLQPIAAKIPKKRRNKEISNDEEVIARVTKRTKTTAPIIDFDEGSEYSDPEPPTRSRSSRDRSTRSLSVTAPQKKAINLIREVATAEEVARKAALKVEAKKKEWKKAKAVAKELEEAAEVWRTRLAIARAEAAAKEREAKGLPPLEKKKKPVYEISSDDEDEENGVERVEDAFGRNNRSNVPPLVPWTQEEKDAIVQGLWDFKDNIATRFYDVYKLPVFRINDRNFDEVFAKIVDFRNDVIDDFPNDEWIARIPETVDG